jgi:hypothetical protein
MNQPLDISRNQVILPERIINLDGEEFKQKYNQSPFMFSHNLAGHPLFEIPRLVELADTLSSRDECRNPVCDVAGTLIDNKWGDARSKEQQVSEVISKIQDSNAWVLLYSVQFDPAYASLLEQIIVELEELVGIPLRQEITWLDTYIFIASPHAVTNHHIDHEATFLFQIQGEREANLFCPNDRQILSDLEIENYYQGDFSAANYKVESQSKAYVFPLIPGKGVHHPVLAPHCYKNESHYSVALGIHFCLRSHDLLARVYQVNYLLRKLGFKPTSPGQSVLQDRLKILLIGLFSKRNPDSKFELIRSGAQRIRSYVRRVKRLVNLIKRRSPLKEE